MKDSRLQPKDPRWDHAIRMRTLAPIMLKIEKSKKS